MSETLLVEVPVLIGLVNVAFFSKPLTNEDWCRVVSLRL
jgi:hypothetical protein